MKMPPEISFQRVEHSDAIAAAVQRHAAKLDKHYSEIVRCRVSVILDTGHAHQVRRFAVRIDLTIPHRELVSNQAHDEDAYVALRDAFKGITRMLDDAVRKERGQVKAHGNRLRGAAVQVGTANTLPTLSK
jgi:ribosomal subunit interface protein